MDTVSFNVPSIVCNICSNKIRDELTGMKGIKDVNMDLKTQDIRVGYDPSAINPTDIDRRITSLGYEIIR
jgi:copper chaperone CopZ